MLMERNRSASTYVFVPCNLSRSGFSGERVFEFNGIKGVSPKKYCFGKDRREIGDDVPPEGKVISGFILARVIDSRNHHEEVTVSLPSGDVVTLSSTMIQSGI